jgi:hypothetical protein
MTPGTVLATNGSTSATNLGLYYYTTATNQTIQGDSRVDIGLHYVAASSNASGWVPLETNGIPDYVADVNGNGIIPPGAANPDSAFYTNIDLDGDGMVGSVETALDKNPLVFDNPLILTQKVTGQEPAVVTLEVGVSHNLVQSIGQLVLMVDGVPAATNQSTQVADDGNCLLVWNTTASTNFPPGQTYFLQAHLILTNSVTNAGVTADGPLIAFNQPIVIIQPPDQTNGLGGTVTFTASATGPGIYTYQWQFDGTNIAGATNSTYTISNLAMTNAGSYTVVVENADGNHQFQRRSHGGRYTACNHITAVEPAGYGGGHRYSCGFGHWNAIPDLSMADVGFDDYPDMDQPSRRDQQHFDHAQFSVRRCGQLFCNRVKRNDESVQPARHFDGFGAKPRWNNDVARGATPGLHIQRRYNLLYWFSTI